MAKRRSGGGSEEEGAQLLGSEDGSGVQSSVAVGELVVGRPDGLTRDVVGTVVAVDAASSRLSVAYNEIHVEPAPTTPLRYPPGAHVAPAPEGAPPGAQTYARVVVGDGPIDAFEIVRRLVSDAGEPAGDE